MVEGAGCSTLGGPIKICLYVGGFFFFFFFAGATAPPRGNVPLMEKLPKRDLETWAVVAWSIWNARNRMHFEASQTPPQAILKSAASLLNDYQRLARSLHGPWALCFSCGHVKLNRNLLYTFLYFLGTEMFVLFLCPCCCKGWWVGGQRDPPCTGTFCILSFIFWAPRCLSYFFVLVAVRAGG